MHNYLFYSLDTPNNVWFSTAVLLLGAVIVGIGMFISPETLGTKLAEEPEKITKEKPTTT
ncbi:hypothetical protein HS1genome_1181 [Sulfodiicoccus acidiphilus]|uniref:Uncharacterized protein n=1 Tax=Sulfodiicoccus acidiphilus TaxID=1670455 RepID=A0A348B3P0_9CREN|nr:hypothetical protein [Sulfodiicoccus acidiphilus]BBD72792.1 hypothetical protein HS1genome_1181 [Sulfodiicoccus acidiphilus]GGT99846.1 hypothetical protein GCM10007116_16540 [Sulfodiicoccus acidiphilus]